MPNPNINYRARKNYRLFLCEKIKEGGIMDFDYFYNREVEKSNFLKVPEILVVGENYRKMIQKEKLNRNKERLLNGGDRS